MATIIKGDMELRLKLAKLKDLSNLVPAVHAAAVHVKGKIAHYPPSSGANVPGGPGSQWYIRGWGSKWMRMDGTVNGRMSSEDLGQKWSVYSNKSGLKQIIGNNTSYGKYVQDPNDQTDFHKRRGWKDTDTVANEEEETVLKMLKQAVDKILAGR